MVALLLGIASFMMMSESSYAQEATESANLIVEAPAQVALGEVVVLTLRLEGEVEVGGFEAQILYGREAGEFAGFSPLATSAEQGLGRLIVPELAGGSAVGFYTCGTEPCMKQREVQIQAAAASGALAQVELLALVAGQLEINVAHVQVVDATGKPIAFNMPVAQVVVQVGEETQRHVAPASAWAWTATTAAVEANASAADITSDGMLTHSDVMEVAMGWQIMREEGMPCGGSEMVADVNGDGCVDIIDVQLAAAFAGGGNTPVIPELPDLPERLFLPLTLNAGEGAVQTAAVMTFIVNSALDEYDIKQGNRICRTTSGVCTLRAAIAEVNAHPGPDIILFAIPGGGVQTIQLGGKLPSLHDGTGGTLIDGYSQPEAAVNTDPVVSNAQIRIEVRGNGSDAFDALPITSAGNTVRGVAFYNMKRSLWIYGGGAYDNFIVGNFIGTNAAGTFKFNVTSNLQAHGIHVEQGAQDNHIGGVLPAERNIISGNARHGVGMWHVGTLENVVLNNLVGLSPNGTQSVANRVHGVDINYGASYNIVGGLQPGERNVISGNNGKGAEISHGEETTQNVIIGNYIGTDVTGTSGPPYSRNSNYGISVKDRVVHNSVLNNVVGNNIGGVAIDNFGTCCASFNVFQDNRVGIGVDGNAIGNELYGIWAGSPGSQIGPGNIIAYNPMGIKVGGQLNDGNTITQNSIFGNTGLGIDITPHDQVNPNDANDVDKGPNQQLNFPILATAWPTLIKGTACANCTVEIFIADGGENDYGEGKTFIGTGLVDSGGAFAVVVSGAALGDILTATATDADGNTSEFSHNKVVTQQQPWEQEFVIPGRIEAEDYRVGGAGVGYSDTTAGNSGNAYRNDDVDIAVTQDSSGHHNIGWIAAGEWLSYDINVMTTGTYLLTARVATPNSGRRFHIEIDGNNISGAVTIPWSGGWQNWTNVTVTIPLSAGLHVLRFVAETDKFNLNYYDISAQ
jgi:hypothetical protein